MKKRGSAHRFRKIVPDFSRIPNEYRNYVKPLYSGQNIPPEYGKKEGRGGRLFISVVRDQNQDPCFEHAPTIKAGVLWLYINLQDRSDGTNSVRLSSETNHADVRFVHNLSSETSFVMEPSRRNTVEYQIAVKSLRLSLRQPCDAEIRTEEAEFGPGLLVGPLVSRVRVVNRKETVRMPLKRLSIVIVDMVGYGYMAGALEEIGGAKLILRLNENIGDRIKACIRKQVLKPEHVVHQARGDGALLIFEEPKHAIKFASDLHLAASAAHTGSRRRFELYRVGVATGDVAVSLNGEGNFDQIAGDTVIRAARLEPCAPPGGTLIDSETYHRLAKSDRVGFGRLKTHETKGGDKIDAAMTCGIESNRDVKHDKSLAAAKAVERAVIASYLVELLHNWGKSDSIREPINLIELRLLVRKFADGSESRLKELLESSKKW